MKTKMILLGYFLCLFHFNIYATEKQKLDESIIKDFQELRGMFITPIPALAFCVPEVSFALQKDSIFVKYWADESKRIASIKNGTKDYYLMTLLQLQFLKDSLTTYYTINKDTIIKQFIDTLDLIPEYKLKKQDMYLFFKSFSDASGVGAQKIETILITQDLNMVFGYIQNDKQAKERFLEWIDEDIEVWCPAVGSSNRILNNRIKKYLYERLSENSSPLAQQAVKKMKDWFGY
jgi:hypothetical protein